MADTVSRNPSSDLARTSQTCLWHSWFLKFAFPDGGCACRELAAEIRGAEGKGSGAAGWWLPRKGKKKDVGWNCLVTMTES